MKKTFFTLFALAVSMLALNAQDAVKSYESTGKLDKKISGSCVAIKVNTDLKSAQNLMEALLKKEGLKGKKSGKTLNYEKTVFPTISTDYLNLNIAFEVASKDKNNPVTTVLCFVSKGVANEFVTSSADPQLISNLKAFLDTKYAGTVYDNDVAAKKLAKEKEIKATEDDLKSLDKTIDKRTKDISSYEKDIKKANENIEKAKADIENAKKTTVSQKALLQKQQDELKQIK